MDDKFNLDGVQHERARRIVDAPFCAKRDQLDECLYGERHRGGPFKRDGATGWLYGHSAPFGPFDVTVASLPLGMKLLLDVQDGQEILTPDQARKLHSTLQHALECAYTVALIKAARKLKEPYPEEEINPVRDMSRARLFKEAVRRKNEAFEAQLRDANITTFKQMVDLYNSIPLTTDGKDDEPVPVQSRGNLALLKLRAFEEMTGVKVRSLVGTLPEE